MISFNSKDDKPQDKAKNKAEEEIKKKAKEDESKTKDEEVLKKIEEEKKKKEEEEKKAKKPKKRKMEWGNLVVGIISGLIELILMFIVGARVLFACKIAQFNVLPTDINCMPYFPNNTNNPSPDFQNFSPEASIDKIYIGKGEDAVLFATKIKYDINKETMENKILDYIRKIEYNPTIGPLMKYLMVVITNLFVFFYGGTSFVFNKINEMLPE